MVKKVINVGVEGNDASGDPIREAFIKTNENFNEIYSFFGRGDGISITALSEGPEEVLPNSILLAEDDGLRYRSRILEASGALVIDTNTDPNKVIFKSESASVKNDLEPELGGHLDARGLSIGRLSDPDPIVAASFGTSIDSFAISKGYADNRYVNTAGDTMTGRLSVPAGAIGTQVPQVQEVLKREGGVNTAMLGPLILNADPTEESNPLTATTKRYVDSAQFSSSVNFFVATTGDDFQFVTPVEKKGRDWSYAFRSLSAALQYAEQVLEASEPDVGPYVKTITFNDGASESTILDISETSPSVYTLTISNNGTQTDARDSNDIRTGHVIRGKTSGAIVRIDQVVDGLISFTPEVGGNVPAEEYIVSYLSTQKTLIVGENIEYADPIKSLQVTIFIEGGTYFENYPLKVPANVSIVGDELRRTIIKPLPGRSSSPFVDIYFRRDTVFDSNLNPVAKNYGRHYLTDPDKILYTGTLSNPGGYFGASNLLALNREFIQEEIIAYINNELNGLDYDADKCRRDFGLIIDALAFDLAFSTPTLKTNYRSIRAGQAYYRGTQAAEVFKSQRQATLFGLDKLNEQLDALVPFVPAKNSIFDNIELIKNIFNIGVEATPAIVWNPPDTLTLAQFNVKEVLKKNTEYLIAETIAFITINYSTLNYDQSSCIRDTRYLLEAVIYDLTYGGNSQTVATGDAYYYSTQLQIALSEKAATLAAYNYLATIVEKLAKGEGFPSLQTNIVKDDLGPFDTEGFVANAVKNLILSFVTIVDTGVTPAITEPSVSWTSVDLQNSFNLLRNSTNKTLVTTNILDSINEEFFIYNSELCKRDTGLIVDALAYDLFYSGNYKSMEAANSYFYSASSLIAITDQLTQTVAALEKINEIANLIILETVIDEENLYQTFVPQVISPRYTGETEATDVIDQLVTFMIAVISQSNSYNPPLDNDMLDVFLLNDATIIRNLSCQGHGGFMCVLDPLGQILNKSPYIQTASSFSKSINAKIFAGGVFVDAFVGNLEAEVVSLIDPTTITVKGLTERLPLVPCSFFVKGIRFLVDRFENWDKIAGTVTVYINSATPDDETYTDSSTFQDSTRLLLPSTTFEFVTPGNTSMLANDFTQINDLGYGLVATNGGLIEAVSVFTYYCQVAYYSNTGGQIRSINGSCAHGSIALKAEGSDPLEVPDDITLKYDMGITGRVYSPIGTPFENEKDDLIIHVEDLSTDYLPVNQCEIEVIAGVAPELFLDRYTITSSQVIEEIDAPRAPVKTLYRLFLSATGLGSTGFQGLKDSIPDGTPITLRQNLSLWVQDVAKNTATRPSTALVMKERSNQVYRVISYGNIAAANGTFAWNGQVITVLKTGHGLAEGQEIITSYSAGTNGNPTSGFTNVIINPSPALQAIGFPAVNPSPSNIFYLKSISPSPNFSEGVVTFSSNLQEGIVTLKEGFRSVNITVYYDGSTQPYQPYTPTISSSSSITNAFTCAATIGIIPLSPIQFTGTVGGVTAGVTYYVNTILNNTSFTISNSLITTTSTSSVSGVNRIQVGSSAGMIELHPIVFTGNTFGTIVANTVYYINRIIDANNITISSSLLKSTVTETTASTSFVTISSTSSFIVGNPIKFIGVSFGNLVSGQIYYIKTIENGTQITISSTPDLATTYSVTDSTGTMSVITVNAVKTVTSVAGIMAVTTIDSEVSLTTQTASMYGTTEADGFTYGVVGSKKLAIRDLSQFDFERIFYGIENNQPMIFCWYGKVHQITAYYPSNETKLFAHIEIDYLGGTGLAYPVGLVEAQFSNTPNLKVVLPANSPGDITIKISTLRVTGHDMLRIGTGSYADTNFPNVIYGDSVLTADQAAEVVEIGKGRVFYVTSDQDGNFRVGDFFKVDQGTGTVTFSASIAISNLDGLGFKRGVAIAEFSVDDTMFDNGTDTVPTEQAVRSYIDRRLGITYGGGIVSDARLIPNANAGFMSLSGQLPMKNDMNMGGFNIKSLNLPVDGSDAANKDYVDLHLKRQGGIRNNIEQFTMVSDGSTTIGAINMNNNRITLVTDPLNPQDAANKRYVDTLASLQNELKELTDVELNTSIATDSFLIYNGSKWVNGAQSGLGDVVFTLVANTVTGQIQPNVIVNSDVSATANIAQSKLSMTIASAQAAAPTGTTGQIQALNGIASFDSANFNVTNGFVTVKNNGITLSKLAQMAGSTVIGNSSGLSATPSEITFSTVVQSGGALFKSISAFSSPIAGNFALTTTGDGSTYSIVNYTTTNTNGALVQRDTSDGSINVTSANITSALRVNNVTVLDAPSSVLKLYTPTGTEAVNISTVSSAAQTSFLGTVSTARANVLSQTLTDGATITWDTSLGQIATLTLTGTNRVFANPTNLRVGTYILHIIQGTGGSKTILSWGNVFKWSISGPPVLTTTAGRRDVLSFICDGTNLYGSYLPDVG